MTIHTILRAVAGDQTMRVQRRWPHVDWTCVWKNLSDAPVPDSTRITWYRAIHELVPTNERLQRIQKAPTDTCKHCALDTLEHRLTDFGEGREIWEYAKILMAKMLSSIPSRIPDDWLLHPPIPEMAPKRRRAILWTLAQTILFRTLQLRTLTRQDFQDFLRRSRWKLTRLRQGR
jgi:hypothetical protein